MGPKANSAHLSLLDIIAIVRIDAICKGGHRPPHKLGVSNFESCYKNPPYAENNRIGGNRILELFF